MKKTALSTLIIGAVCLAVLVAAPSLGLDLPDDVRGLLMTLAGSLSGLAGGLMLPQAK